MNKTKLACIAAVTTCFITIAGCGSSSTTSGSEVVAQPTVDPREPYIDSLVDKLYEAGIDDTQCLRQWFAAWKVEWLEYFNDIYPAQGPSDDVYPGIEQATAKVMNSCLM